MHEFNANIFDQVSEEAKKLLIRSEASPGILQGEDLDLAQEGEWYKNQIIKLQNNEYYNEILELLNRNTYINNISPETKAFILIPVGASLESETIYNTLLLYDHQENINKEEFTIILGVNTIEGQYNSPILLEKINKTIEEIIRAKNDFPELNICIINYEISKSLLEKRNNQPEGPGIIGDITRRLYDFSILTATDHVKKNSSRSKDILLIRSDADIVGMSPLFIYNMLKASYIMPKADIFQGEKQYGINDAEISAKLPGLVLTKAFDAFLIGSKSKDNIEEIFLNGSNFAIRASSFAAIGGMGSVQFAGAGSDDVNIGKRIRAIRNDGVGFVSSTKYVQMHKKMNTEKAIQLSEQPIRYVASAIDSDPTRQISTYILGLNPNSNIPWLNYSKGEFGVRPRDVDTPEYIQKESLDETILRVSNNIVDSLKDTNRGEAEYLLLRFFGNSEYTKIYSDNFGKVNRIEFTELGKEYIKKYVDRDEGSTELDVGYWASRNRKYMRRGSSVLRWITPNSTNI